MLEQANATGHAVSALVRDQAAAWAPAARDAKEAASRFFRLSETEFDLLVGSFQDSFLVN
jgi:hypothetical protein